MVAQTTQRRAECWRVIPARGSVQEVLVTSHNRPLTFDDGEGPLVYTPQSGFESTASQLQSGLREQNRDLIGVISDDRFTHDHLRAGVWDSASVRVSEVDWRYPHAGAIHSRKYKTGRVNMTGTQFTVELYGLTTRLHAKSGRAVSRPCDADVFDARCALDPTAVAAWTVETVRVLASSQDATEPRRIFQAVSSDLPSTSDDFYKYGKLTWTSGDNAYIGEISVIKAFTDTDRTIELYDETPYAIQDNDLFTIQVGCDKLFSTCRDKFDPLSTGEGNTLNFRGFHLIPGSDHVLRTPSSDN